jgi:hypothetical protein
MTPQERMLTPEWQAWKRKYDESKKQERRVSWAAMLVAVWLVGTLIYGSATGQIKWFQDACRSEECNIE